MIDEVNMKKRKGFIIAAAAVLLLLVLLFPTELRYSGGSEYKALAYTVTISDGTPERGAEKTYNVEILGFTVYNNMTNTADSA